MGGATRRRIIGGLRLMCGSDLMVGCKNAGTEGAQVNILVKCRPRHVQLRGRRKTYRYLNYVLCRCVTFRKTNGIPVVLQCRQYVTIRTHVHWTDEG